jgi:HEAT repeat protein
MLAVQTQIREMLADMQPQFAAPLRETFRSLSLNSTREILLSISHAKEENELVSLIWLLARIQGDDTIANWLAQIALSQTNAAARSEAIRGLILHPKLVSLRAVKRILDDDTRPEVRLACAYAIANLHLEEGVESLISLLAGAREDIAVREMAAEGLGVLGIRNAQVRQALRQALNYHLPELVVWSAHAVAALGVRDLLPDLLNARRLAENTGLRDQLDLAISRLNHQPPPNSQYRP